MTDEARNRTVQVLRFLGEFDRVRQSPVRHLRQHLAHFLCREFPTDPGCTLHLDALATDDPEEPTSATPRTAPLLTVLRQRLTKAPPPPEELAGWLQEAGKDPAREPRVIPARAAPTPAGPPEPFGADLERVAIFERWLRDWQRWAAAEQPRRRVQALYEQLYDLHLRLKRDTEEVELVWGAGLLGWHVSAENLLHPLVVARVELTFDRDEGRLQVIPTAAMPEIVEEMFLGISHPALEEFQRIVREFHTGPFAPWHRAYVAALLRQVANSLGAQTRVVEEVPRPDPDALLSGDNVLILRKRRVGFGRDIEQWIA